MNRLSHVTLAVTAMVTALPAAAQFAKPEDAVKYRQSAMALQGATLGRVFAMANGRVPFDAKVAADNIEIVTGVVIPPDAKTFLTQARQQGFKPKVITLGKALLFPGAIEALGDLGDGLTSEVWWSPSHPYKSSLSGQTAKALAESYEAATKKQWTQPIGFAHALFEVAADVLKRSRDSSNKALRDALAATNLATVVGGVKWGGQGPFRNVSKTPLVLGQWVKGKKRKYELVIVNNQAAPAIPSGGKMKLIQG